MGDVSRVPSGCLTEDGVEPCEQSFFRTEHTNL
jgi:hypothetical protein